MNTRTTFYVGTGYTSEGQPIAPESLAMALAVIRAKLTNAYDGFTEIDAMGGWNDGTTVIMESAKRFETMDGFFRAGWTLPQAINKARELAQSFADVLQQSSVLFTVEEMHAEFTERATA